MELTKKAAVVERGEQIGRKLDTTVDNRAKLPYVCATMQTI